MRNRNELLVEKNRFDKLLGAERGLLEKLGNFDMYRR